jgi:hypothetical protein
MPYRAMAMLPAEVAASSDQALVDPAPLRRHFLAQAILGTLFCLVLYPPAIWLACLLLDRPSGVEAQMAAFAIFAALVSGMFMLVYAYRLASALRRNEVPRISSVYIPYSVLHYAVCSLPCLVIACLTFPSLPVLFFLPALFCLHAMFCSIKLHAFLHRLRAGLNLQEEAEAARYHRVG